MVLNDWYLLSVSDLYSSKIASPQYTNHLEFWHLISAWPSGYNWIRSKKIVTTEIFVHFHFHFLTNEGLGIKSETRVPSRLKIKSETKNWRKKLGTRKSAQIIRYFTITIKKKTLKKYFRRALETSIVGFCFVLLINKKKKATCAN